MYSRDADGDSSAGCHVSLTTVTPSNCPNLRASSAMVSADSAAVHDQSAIQVNIARQSAARQVCLVERGTFGSRTFTLCENSYLPDLGHLTHVERSGPFTTSRLHFDLTRVCCP